MGQYSIEARSLSIVGGVASHNFWVLRDDQGRAIAELHGLATDRQSGQAVPIGTDRERHSLRGWHFIHDERYARDFGSPVANGSYIQEGQTAIRVLSGSREEILERWKVAARDGVNLLNAQDRDYPNFGVDRQFGFDGQYRFRVNDSTVNSNSAYHTFGALMVGEAGVPVFRNVLQPGVGNHVLDPTTIHLLQYDRPQFRQGMGENEVRVAGVGTDLEAARSHPRTQEAGRALEQASGLPAIPAEKLDQLAVNLAAASRNPPPTASGEDQQPLQRIGSVAMSTNGRDLIVSDAQADRPEASRISVPLAQMLQPPTETATRTLAADTQALALQATNQQTQAQLQAQTTEPARPANEAPTMRV